MCHTLSKCQNRAYFQAGGNPRAVPFQDHVVNSYNSKIYDATTGVGPYNNLLDYIKQEVYIEITLENTTITYEYDDLSLDNFGIASM